MLSVDFKASVFWVTIYVFVVYVDVIAFKFPFVSAIICPLIWVVMFVRKSFDGLGVRLSLMRCFFGFPVVLLAVAVLTPMLGVVNEVYVKREVGRWGVVLLNESVQNGGFRPSEIRYINGYRAIFINKDGSDPLIVFDKFMMKRQSYNVRRGVYMEEREL